MAGYDLLVMCGCLCLYSLPELWTFFARRAYPHFVAFFLPVVQASRKSTVSPTFFVLNNMF